MVRRVLLALYTSLLCDTAADRQITQDSSRTLGQKVRLVSMKSAMQVDLQSVKSVTCKLLRGKRFQKAHEDQGAEYAETLQQLQVCSCCLHVSCYMPHAIVRENDLIASSSSCCVCSRTSVPLF